jgi:uncharacterized membrane protein YjgN (DUF898 family)
MEDTTLFSENSFPLSPKAITSEMTAKPEREYALTFFGSGMEYFKIQMVSIILNLITFGLYYPWAKAKSLNYLYSKSTLEGDPFAFSGTGQEMFKGFIKAILIFVLIGGIFFLLAYNQYVLWAYLFYFLSLLSLLPFAIHGSVKYRSAKSSWRGIRFGYSGKRDDFTLFFFKWIFLTFITLGLYNAWMTTNIRKYVLGHLKMGDASFEFTGKPHDYFLVNLKGYFFTFLTLGFYIFWWKKDRFEFFVNHLRLKLRDEEINFTSNATIGDFLGLILVNLLILVFSLGLGAPWILVRNMKFGCRHIMVKGNISLEELIQTHGDYTDATGDDMGDLLDLGFTF